MKFTGEILLLFARLAANSYGTDKEKRRYDNITSSLINDSKFIDRFVKRNLKKGTSETDKLRHEIANGIGNFYKNNPFGKGVKPLLNIQDSGGVLLGELKRRANGIFDISVAANLNDGYMPLRTVLPREIAYGVNKYWGIDNPEDFELETPLGSNSRLQKIYNNKAGLLERSIHKQLQNK